MITATHSNKEERNLGEKAASRITNDFKIPEKRQELLNLIAKCNRRYEAFLFDKDHYQRKQALDQISRGLRTAAAGAARLPQWFDDPASDWFLWVTGSLLSRQGFQKLLGHQLKLDRESSEALGEVARQVGPNLIVLLLNAIRQPVDETLALYRLNKGGRPRKHLYRDFVGQELGRNYSRFFGKLPTGSRTGHFARFCAPVLEELQCELEGFDRAFPKLLKAIGVLKPRKKA